MLYKDINSEIDAISTRECLLVESNHDKETSTSEIYCDRSIQRQWRKMMKQNISPFDEMIKLPIIPAFPSVFFEDFVNYFISNLNDGLNILNYLLKGPKSNFSRFPCKDIFMILLEHLPVMFESIIRILGMEEINIIDDFLETNWYEVLIRFTYQNPQEITKILEIIAPNRNLPLVNFTELAFALIEQNISNGVSEILECFEKIMLPVIQEENNSNYICQKLILIFLKLTDQEKSIDSILRIFARSLINPESVDINPVWEIIPQLLNSQNLETIDSVCLFLESVLDYNIYALLSYQNILDLFIELIVESPYCFKEKAISIIIKFIQLDNDENQFIKYLLSKNLVSIMMQICENASESMIIMIFDSIEQIVESAEDSDIAEMCYIQINENQKIYENIIQESNNAFLVKYLIHIGSFLSAYEMQ